MPLTFQEFIIRVRREGQSDTYLGKRYGDFAKLHKGLRTEFPGKHLPPVPRKNKSSTSSSFFGWGEDDRSSVSSISSQDTGGDESSVSRSLTPGEPRHRSHSRSSVGRAPKSPRASGEIPTDGVLFREEQRVSLRAFLRMLLQNKRLAESKSMKDFLSTEPITLSDEDKMDVERRKEADGVRMEEQKRFYEIARQRASELDVYMENFRRDIVESSKWPHHLVCKLTRVDGLTKLFSEIREKQTIEDLSPQYLKFAEWLRIE